MLPWVVSSTALIIEGTLQGVACGFHLTKSKLGI